MAELSAFRQTFQSSTEGIAAPIPVPSEPPIFPELAGTGAEGGPGIVPPPPAPPPPQQSAFMKAFQSEQGTTPGQELEVAGQAAVVGTVQGIGVVGNAMLGGQIGAMAPPPFTPFTTAAGIVTGGLIGAYLGWEATQTLEETGLTYGSLEDVPENLRPMAVAIETITGGTAFAVAPLGIAARISMENAGRAKQIAGRLINSILDTAKKRPTLFFATETGANITAGLGEGIAETVAPGSVGARLIGGLIGGFLSPTRIVLGKAQDLWDTLKNLKSKFGRAGRETKAGQVLREFFEAEGTDPESLILALDEAARKLPVGAKPTAGQLIGEPTLQRFEKELAEVNRQFGADALLKARQTLIALGHAADLLEGTGDPIMLRAAANLRQKQIETAIELRLSVAQDETLKLAAAITEDTPAARAALSVPLIVVGINANSGTILENAMLAGRKVERSLYAAIPRDVPMRVSGIIQRWGRLRNSMTAARFRRLAPEAAENLAEIQEANRILSAAEKGKRPKGMEKLGKKAFQKKVTDAQKIMSSKNLLLVRNDFLDLAREAAGKSEWNNARVFGELAEATKNDIDRGFERAAEAGLLSLDEARTYTRAREYSRAFNDVHTRTFVDAANAVTTKGGPRIPPEVLMRQALATGEEVGVLRFEEMMAAAQFLPEQAAKGAADIPASLLAEAGAMTEQMFDIQGRLFALFADSVVDPETGKLSVKAARRFLKEKEVLLNKFPEVRTRLEAAASSEEAFRGAKELYTQETRALENSAISTLLKTESPADVVRSALAAQDPIKSLTELAIFARKTSPAAIKGLHRAIWQDVLRSSRRADGTLDLRAMAASITQPIRPGLPSLLEWMLTGGIMDKAEADLVRRYVNQAVTVAEAVATTPTGLPILGGGPLDVPDMALDAMFRVVGARGGVKGAKLIGGAGEAGTSLQAAQIGSKIMRQFALRMPELRLQEILADALRGAPIGADGEPYSLLKSLLTTPTDGGHAIQLARQIHAYAWQAGLLTSSEGVFSGFEERDAAPPSAPAEPPVFPELEAPAAPEPIAPKTVPEKLPEIPKLPKPPPKKATRKVKRRISKARIALTVPTP